MEAKCPKCGSGLIETQIPTLASDKSYVDVIANCIACSAELTMIFDLVSVEEDNWTA